MKRPGSRRTNREMIERLITAILVLVAIAIVASGFPLSAPAISGSGGWFNLPLVF
jgi:uncharacterized MnhB-related membrane protein